MEEFIRRFLNKRNPNLGNGKRVKMKDEKIKEILEHNGNVTKFCQEKRITNQMYYRYKNWKTEIKNERDRKRFERIEQELKVEEEKKDKDKEQEKEADKNLLTKQNKPDKRKGKKIKMTDKKIREILEHNGNVTKFCQEKRITRQMYYRYKNWETEIKNERDRKRFARIEKEVENGYIKKI